MTSTNLKHAIWLVMAMSATALAAGGPPAGKGGGGGGSGGGGGGGEETAANNLSMPAEMIGAAAGNLTGCGSADWSPLVPPSGTPQTSFPIDMDAFYYVQGVHKWQAQCIVVEKGSAVSVKGEWGDNLTGDAKLKAGSPIRVELLMFDENVSKDGYSVVKLEPLTLDRLSKYGTLATPDGSGGYNATPVSTRVVVHDSEAQMTITNASGGVVASENPITPEINATGKIVYGYNLRVPAAGQYVITFKMPNVTFKGCDAGTCINDTATLPITVIAGGGGGGGGGKPVKPGK